jgi:hypothetical protein
MPYMRNRFPVPPYIRTVIVVAFVLALILIASTFFYFHRAFQAPAAVAISTAQKSPEFQRSIGEPSQLKFMTTGRIFENNGNGNADLAIPVSGPHGDGKLIEWAQESGGKCHICSLDLQLRNTTTLITIVSDTNTNCERE